MESNFGVRVQGLHVKYLVFADAAGVRDFEPIHGDPFDWIQAIQARRLLQKGSSPYGDLNICENPPYLSFFVNFVFFVVKSFAGIRLILN